MFEAVLSTQECQTHSLQPPTSEARLCLKLALLHSKGLELVLLLTTTQTQTVHPARCKRQVSWYRRFAIYTQTSECFLCIQSAQPSRKNTLCKQSKNKKSPTPGAFVKLMHTAAKKIVSLNPLASSLTMKYYLLAYRELNHFENEVNVLYCCKINGAHRSTYKTEPKSVLL